MSRRQPVGADTAEKNRATLKALVKLESNKSCADCKKNKHPRWASWNIGVFVCIRCSGIHRSMGVHISRVKSVDLDSWTDGQMQNMLRWGNSRANKYWEHKLAEGHVPNDAKIENFIRTKYDSKRWVMDGPIPDPATLDDGSADDDMPLNVVQERVRSGSVRNGSAPSSLPQPPRARPQDMDLFGDPSGPVAAPARPNTTEPAVQRPGPPKAPVAPPKQTKPGESLLGLDFFGGAQSAPPRPSSATSGLSTPGAPGRTDLKNSILSLYASAPKAAAPPPQPQSNANFLGGMQSPPMTSSQQQQPSNAQSLGGLGDAFGSLSFSSPPQQQQQPKSSPFAGLSSPTTQHRPQRSSLSGGSFFDAKPAPPPKPTSPPSQPAPRPRQVSNGFGDFGDFSSGPSPVISTKSPPAAPPTTVDLFGVSSPSAPALPPKQASVVPKAAVPSYPQASAFNLSQPTQVAPKLAAPAQTSTSSFSLSSTDAWGSNDAWAAPDPPSKPAQAPPPAPAQTSTSTFKAPPAPAVTSTLSAFDSGWGDPEPPNPASTSGWGAPEPAKPAATSSAGGFSVQQDEEFGGWSHASPVATAPKQAGFGGQDDPFGNPWG